MQDNTADESGLLNINKPTGVTSFWVVRELKKLLKVKRVGHCGTLDPLAQGVLLVVFGKATKLQSLIMASKKIYKASLLLGRTTDSGDITGVTLSQNDVPLYTKDTINAVIRSFEGESEQIPPMYSALKHKGKRLYELARAGQTVERSPRKITIYSTELLANSMERIEIRVVCSKGTYIRTLAEDIGAKLGCGATIESLVREEVFPYNISDSLELASLKVMSRDKIISESITLDQLKAYFMEKL